MEAKGKILIVDDNEDVLFALNLLLEPYVEKVKVTTQPSRVEHFMTTAGFPHSEICGLIGYLLLTAAYRSLSRPSSAPDAMAFTLCSY